MMGLMPVDDQQPIANRHAIAAGNVHVLVQIHRFEAVNEHQELEAVVLQRIANGRQLRHVVIGGGAASAEAPDQLRVNSQTHEVWIGEELFRRRLSSQEFQLLSYLYEQHPRVCTRRELGDAIWGEYNWDLNMLHRLVHRLKEKVEPDSEQPRYVQTVSGVGYRITP